MKKKNGCNVRGASLLDPLVGAVLGLEEEVCGPVVGEVLGKAAGGAGGLAGDVAGGHGHVERVSSDDLVDVRRGDLAGVDQGVETVDNHLSTSESQHGKSTAATAAAAEPTEATTELGRRLSGRCKGEESGPLHCERSLGMSQEDGMECKTRVGERRGISRGPVRFLRTSEITARRESKQAGGEHASPSSSRSLHLPPATAATAENAES